MFLLTIIGFYQKTLFSMKWNVFLVKRGIDGPIAKCIVESCLAAFDKCFGAKNSWFKYLPISSKSFVIFLLWNCKSSVFLVSMILSNHFFFVLKLKSLFSLLVTNSADRRSFLTSSLKDLTILKPWNAAVPSSILIMALILSPLQRFVKGQRTFVKT